MITVEILSGAYGYQPPGTNRVRAVCRGERCDVTETEAARLVSLGVAKVFSDAHTATEWPVASQTSVGSDDAQPTVQKPVEEPTEPVAESDDEELTREKLEAMSYQDLRKLAAEMDVVPGHKKKGEIIDEILDDDMPDLSVEGPVL